MADLPPGFLIRKAEAGDHAALLEICLKTGDSGQDATPVQDYADLLGLVFALPYAIRCPDFAFVVEDAAGVCGYALGAPDTLGFQDWLDSTWFPPLRARLHNPGPDPARWQHSDWLRWRIFAPLLPPPVDLAAFPAHGHIDLLPRAQGKGIGAHLIGRVITALQEAGRPGMHLEVSPRNLRARGFYVRLGFALLDPPGVVNDTVYMGKRFGTSRP